MRISPELYSASLIADRTFKVCRLLEKAGTVHIAFGDNKSMGGSVRVASHLDGLVRQPTVWLDESKIMANGSLLVAD